MLELIELIRRIPGKSFLGIYFAYCVIVLIVTKLIFLIMNKIFDLMVIDSNDELNAYEITLIKHYGFPDYLAQTMFFKLCAEGYLEPAESSDSLTESTDNSKENSDNSTQSPANSTHNPDNSTQSSGNLLFKRTDKTPYNLMPIEQSFLENFDTPSKFCDILLDRKKK
ncbi:MAG TPA: hypothetical protein PK033_00640 [Acetivibrio sp.]|nr:hypothetical protein [Acetivibrio sp.]